jgi:XTP/dITP diphosphohydrolase
MKQLLLASRNQDKVREFTALLNEINAQLISLEDVSHVGEIVEDADTLEGNAYKKAREVSRLTRLPTLADDSGLEVLYLNKEPGVHSSRYAGPKATYSENCKKLLQTLRGVPPRRRAARFRCVVVFITPDGVEKIGEGICRGVITEQPRGTHGFGYDSIFLPEGYTQTFAEMDSSLKNKFSHRAKAIQTMYDVIKDYYRTLGNP